jgi:CO dehydrogenase maturation factor
MVIAISGKGGVGKTTLAALTIRWLKERGKGPVLAVDADPNSNLNEPLGLPVAETIGDIREETQTALQNLPPSMTKEMYLSMRIQECIVESRGLDLLSMGRQEGPGCYCYINHLLRGYLDGLHKHYAHVVIDNEAGMEHLSRRTTQNVDALLIVSDLSQGSLQAAGRIRDLARKLQLKVGHSYLVLNRVAQGKGRAGEQGSRGAGEQRSRGAEEQGKLPLIPHLSSLIPHPSSLIPLPPAVAANVAATGLDLLGTVPRDDLLEEFSLTGRPVWELPEDAPALRTIGGLLERLGERK